MPTADLGRIFISYRRKENGWPARQLYQALSDVFGEDRVFKDVDSIEPGDNFVASVRTAVSSCTVLLALVGTDWANLTDKQGRRRLDDPDDFVRLEIETALRRGIRVIPILIDDAEMPRSQDLPPRLVPLVNRQAITISPVTFDTSRLVRTIRESMKAASAGAPEADLQESPSQAVPDHPDWGSVPDPAERQRNGLSTPPAGEPGPGLLAKAPLTRPGTVVVIVGITLVLLLSGTVWYVHRRAEDRVLDLPVGPAISPTQLIVSRYKKLTPPGMLWLVDSVNPDLSRRLDAVQHGTAYGIGISPDRRTITYVDGGSAVRAMPAAGGSGRLLFNSPPGCGRINHKSWSRTDMSVLVLECQVEAGPRRLVVVDVNGTIIRELDTGRVQPSDPTISPDGTTIAFCGTLSDSSEEGGNIYVMPIDGSSELTPVTDSAAEADSDPAWSADGTSIAFRRRVGPPRGEKFNGDNRLEDTDILTVAATGGPVRTLVTGSATDDKPSWSPDGRTIAFISNRDGDGSRTRTKDVWLVSADGGKPSPLRLKAPRYAAPAWSSR